MTSRIIRLAVRAFGMRTKSSNLLFESYKQNLKAKIARNREREQERERENKTDKRIAFVSRYFILLGKYREKENVCDQLLINKKQQQRQPFKQEALLKLS
ncbi:hypothetical protein BpHYR1_015027 [Brachionus plicatilis]|uniref:Uncharacterized protein n=1 Tax=Brachionus plicatilis TaxID=10195 RepID=A0A3M7RIY1_BRAPC|nr:hypothetical protein BpHYR1_015027 [Brachionus plicatilis]